MDVVDIKNIVVDETEVPPLIWCQRDEVWEKKSWDVNYVDFERLSILSRIPYTREKCVCSEQKNSK